MIDRRQAEAGPSERYVTRPPRWARVLVGFGFVMMAVVSVAFLVWDRSMLWGLTGAGLTVLFALGVVDSATAFVSLGEENITVRSNFRVRRIPFADVTEVKREGGRVFLRLEGGQWYRFPEWCEGGVGFQNRIAARLRRHREG